MAIFTKEFEDNLENKAKILHDSLSDAHNTMWIHLIIWVCISFGSVVMMLFGIVGMDIWWKNFSSLNPNVLIETTTYYWAFMFSIIALNAAIICETIYVGLLIYVQVMRPCFSKKSKESLPIPQVAIINSECPYCHSTSDVIKKGKRNGNNRYYCKKCKKYYTVFSIYGD